MSNEKKEVAKVATMPKKAEPKTESAQTANAQSITEILEAQLKEIQRKKKLADNRVFFIEKKKELKDCVTALNDEIASGSFSTDRFVLKFGRRNSYRDDEQIFTISNTDVLIKFILSLQEEIDTAVSKIEKELLANLA